MESNNKTVKEYHLKLDRIPPEIFLHICSFLSSKFVINVLSEVCQKFKDLIENEATWRMRICRRWPKRYPLISVPDLDWKNACIEREECYTLWKYNEENMRMFHLKEAHFGCVNVVSLLEESSICASGGRDGALSFWDTASLKEMVESADYKSCRIHTKPAAHGNAWLWSITYDVTNKVVYSSGFDCKIHSWNLEDPSDPVMTFNLASPILCLSFFDNILASGCYGRSVNVFDPRLGKDPVSVHIHHKRPVICMATDHKFIISGSEDKTVVVFDKVAGKVLRTLPFEAFPLSMSYDLHQLLVGDVRGSFHVIDPTEGSFELLHSYETGHKQKVTGIQHSLGAIFTCSTDKSIRILEPNADPETIAVINGAAEVSRISAYKTSLASANTDDSISIWLPTEECS